MNTSNVGRANEAGKAKPVPIGTVNNEFVQQLLSTDEAAQSLGVTPRMLEDLRRRGGGPKFVRISNSKIVRYRPRDLNASIEERVKSSTSEG